MFLAEDGVLVIRMWHAKKVLFSTPNIRDLYGAGGAVSRGHIKYIEFPTDSVLVHFLEKKCTKILLRPLEVT